MSSLYELSNELLAIKADIDALGCSELTESTLAQLESVEKDIKNKVDGYVYLIRYYRGLQSQAFEEVNRLKDREQWFKDQQQWLSNRLLNALQDIGETKVQTALNTVTVAGNGGVKPLKVLQEHLPEEYFKAVIKKLPDNDKIRKELEAGVEIPGCKLEERGKHLILK